MTRNRVLSAVALTVMGGCAVVRDQQTAGAYVDDAAITAVGATIEWYDFFLYAAAAGLVFAQLFFEPAGAQLVARPVEGAQLDGMVCLTSCDKTVPGQLMAADFVRKLDVPTRLDRADGGEGADRIHANLCEQAEWPRMGAPKRQPGACGSGRPR